MQTLLSFKLSGAISCCIVLTLLSISSARAQPVDSMIIRGKRLLEVGYDTGEVRKLRRAAALFERVASGGAGAHDALAHYYAGLAHLRIVNITGHKDQEEALKHLDVAIEHLEAAVAQREDFADAYALLSSVYGRKISLKPRLGRTLGPKSAQALKTARTLAPDNPRVVFIQATSDYFTPEAWGGSKEKAMQGFRRAIELFEQQEITDPLQPDWGHSDAYAWLGFAYMRSGQYEKARQALRRALEIDPDFGWVTEVLLPQLRGKAGES